MLEKVHLVKMKQIIGLIL